MLQFLFDLYFRYWKRWGWFGDYTTWQAAQAICTGYDAAEISEKVRNAALKVKNGEAAFERDSVLFYDTEYDQNLLDCIEKIYHTAGFNPDILAGMGMHIIDFGGSLGSTYFQHRKILNQYPNLTWCVVEQKHFVDIGKKEFEEERLFFEYTLKEACHRVKPNFLLLNSVLQYVEKPYELLEEIRNTGVSHILIQRTPMINDGRDHITQQIAHPSVYKASYPSWVFGEQSIKSKIADTMTIEWWHKEKYGWHHVTGKPLFLQDIYITNRQ